MPPVTRPTKQQVRDWLKQQLVAKTPPPPPAEVRRQLGWELINKSADCVR